MTAIVPRCWVKQGSGGMSTMHGAAELQKLKLGLFYHPQSYRNGTNVKKSGGPSSVTTVRGYISETAAAAGESTTPIIYLRLMNTKNHPHEVALAESSLPPESA